MRRHTARGFTLIELLVVMVVLGILVALLVPAITAAVRSAENAAVAAELNSVAQGMAAFHTKFGSYPPSRIVVAEDGDYSSTNLGISAALGPRTVTALRRFWPRMALATDGTKPTIPGGFYDVNGDQKKNPPYILTGSECLVLFLGGVPQKANKGWVVTGFAKNPVNPFAGGTNRDVPFFGFEGGKLITSQNASLGTGQMPCYADRFGAMVAYFSSYNGVGYDPDDVNLQEPDLNETLPEIRGAFQTNNTPTGGGNSSRADYISSPSPNPYTVGDPVPAHSDGTLDVFEKRNTAWINANTFQLISAGKDGVFGVGGSYDAKTKELRFNSAANAAVTGQTLQPAERYREKDNLTNFAGKLD